MLNRLLGAALVAGLVAGLTTAAIQQFTTTPMILEAEKYEGGGEAVTVLSPGSGAFVKASLVRVDAAAEEEWGPQDGFERVFYTSTSTVGVAFGFALILLGAMILAGEPTNARTGLAWGLPPSS